MKYVRRVAFALGVFLALYLVGVNAFLNTPLFVKVVDSEPDVADIHFSRAWSIIPTMVHAKNVSIRVRDSKVEWILKIDDATFHVSFLSLIGHRFNASHVHATGVSFRLRSRLDAWPTPAEESLLTDVPAIEGLGRWSMRGAEDGSGERWSDAAYKLWGARLESTTAEHVREVWLDHHRFEGDAKIVGRFQLVPLRSVDVGPAHVTLQAGRVMRGQALLADGIRGEGDVTFERFDPRGADMERVLGKMKIDADLVARAPNAMAWVQNPPPDMDGELPWEARKIAAHIDHGAIAPPTHVEIFAPDGWLRKGEIAVAGSALVVLDTEAEETVVRADLTQLSASHAPTKTRVLGAGATIEMRSGRVQLGKTGFDDFDYRGAVRDGTIPALRAGQPFLGAHPPLVIEGGHAAFSAEGTYSPRQHTVSLRSQTRVQRFAFTHDKRHFVADVDADVRVGKFGEQASSFDFRDSHVSLRNVDVTGGFADTHAWSGEVKLAPAVLALDEHPRLDMRAAVEARDPNPVLAWVLGAGLPGLLESYTKMSPLSATARIVVAPELGAVTEVAARGGGLQAHGGYAKRGSRGRAAFHVELPPLSAGIAVAGDSVRVVPFADDAWLAHEVAPINADASASTGTQTPPATRAAVASGQVAR